MVSGRLYDFDIESALKTEFPDETGFHLDAVASTAAKQYAAIVSGQVTKGLGRELISEPRQSKLVGKDIDTNYTN